MILQADGFLHEEARLVELSSLRIPTLLGDSWSTTSGPLMSCRRRQGFRNEGFLRVKIEATPVAHIRFRRSADGFSLLFTSTGHFSPLVFKFTGTR